MIVAIILARGNSKRIPRKNLKPLGGKALVEWTMDAAYQARRFGFINQVYLTTENLEIAELGQMKYLIPWLARPKELSQDHVQSSEVFLFALRQLQYINVKPTALVLLAPTSPLRTAQHIPPAVYFL